MKQRKNRGNGGMSRREVLKLMGGAASMATLAACVPAAPAPTEGGEGTTPDEAPISMAIQHRREYFPEMEEIFQDAVEEWAAANNVEMNVSTVGAEATEDYVPKLVAAVEAGNPPDAVYHVRLVNQLHFLDAIQPVSDTVDRAVEQYGEPAFAHRLQNVIDGEWFAIPLQIAGGGDFARGDLFEEAGFAPLEIETWNELREASVAVSNAPELYGWGASFVSAGDGQGLVQSIIHSWGGQITNEDMTELTFDSPETIEAVAWLTETFTEFEDMLPPGILSWTDSSNNEAYLAGDIGWTSNAASVYASAKANESPLFDTTVVLNTPVGPTGVKHEGGGNAGGFVIPRGAANPELGQELALHMLQPDIFLPISLISAGLYLPAYTGFYSMEEVEAAFEEDPNLRRMGEQALGDYPGLSWPAQPSAFFDNILAEAILSDMISQTVAQGLSPEEAVAQATERMNTIAEELQIFGG